MADMGIVFILSPFSTLQPKSQSGYNKVDKVCFAHSASSHPFPPVPACFLRPFFACSNPAASTCFKPSVFLHIQSCLFMADTNAVLQWFNTLYINKHRRTQTQTHSIQCILICLICNVIIY